MLISSYNQFRVKLQLARENHRAQPKRNTGYTYTHKVVLHPSPKMLRALDTEC